MIVKNNGPLKVAEPEPEYNKHGDWQPSPEILKSNEFKLAWKMLEIITSNTNYSSALISNINAFYQAVQDAKEKEYPQKLCKQKYRKEDNVIYANF